jgi:FixJ family two-component response regulator
MPEMNGLELQRHLAGNGITIPTILITAHGDADLATATLSTLSENLLRKKPCSRLSTGPSAALDSFAAPSAALAKRAASARDP